MKLCCESQSTKSTFYEKCVYVLCSTSKELKQWFPFVGYQYECNECYSRAISMMIINHNFPTLGFQYDDYVKKNEV